MQIKCYEDILIWFSLIQCYKFSIIEQVIGHAVYLSKTPLRFKSPLQCNYNHNVVIWIQDNKAASGGTRQK